jgi:hypothetical protein
MTTKNAHECEVHYYTFYYKGARDKAPTREDMLTSRTAGGGIVLDEARMSRAKERERAYILKKQRESQQAERGSGGNLEAEAEKKEPGTAFLTG